jgi:hypothetical protein
MATATAKKPAAKTSVVRNPSRPLLVGATTNPPPKKRKKKNPSTVTTVKTVRRKVKRNPSVNGTMALALSGLAGGLTLGLIEAGINTLAPNASRSAQIIIKAGAAWLVSQFGGSVPVVGKYKGYVAGILALFAGYDVWRYYVAPMLSNSGLQLPFGFSLFTEQHSPQQQQIAAPQPQQFAPMVDSNGLAAFVNPQGEVELYPA